MGSKSTTSDDRQAANSGAPDDDGQRGLFDLAGQRIDSGSRIAVPAPPPIAAKPLPPKLADDKTGHRARLLERFRNGGADALPDYELLEMVLFRAIPRGDTKPIAKRLLARFKTLAEVFNAAPDRLKEVEGIGQRAVDEIKLVRAASLRLMQKEVMHREVLSTWDAVIAYCKAAQGHDDIERFRILFLDKRNQLIADEVQQSGTVDHTPVYLREIVKRALELSATALVLVHNHPTH